MNSINLTGRITKDLELRKTPQDASVCQFSIAVKRPHTKDTTDFFDIVAWRQSAEYISNYGHKGNLVEVTGVLTSRKYTDKNGNQRVAFEIIADNVSLLESKSASGSNESYTEVAEDSLPF